VVLNVDNPQFSSGLWAGSKGTVICGNTSNSGDLDVLISWDDWHQGHDGNGICEDPVSQPPDGVDTSWWVSCTDVSAGSTASCACNGVYEIGDRVRLLEDSLTVSLPAGSIGTIACGAEGPSISLPLLVSWDNFTGGHGGNGYCTCPDTSLSNNSGYWVACDDIAKEYVSIFEDGFEDGDTSKWSLRQGWWCPDNSTDEGVPCPEDGDVDDDDPNGGCNANPNSFGAISIDETICGTVGTFTTNGNTSRDTDWYRFTAPSSGSYTITARSNVALLIGFVNENGCTNPAFIDSTYTTAGQEASVTTTLDAGTNTVFVASGDFAGVPCTGYTLTLTQR